MQSIPQGNHRTGMKEKTSVPTSKNEKDYKGIYGTTLCHLDEMDKFLDANYKSWFKKNRNISIDI